MQVGEDLEHVGGVGGVEGAGRLVGEDHQWLGHDGPGQRHALLLPTGHLHRAVVGAGAEPELFEGSDAPLAAFFGADVPVQQRGLYVADCRQVGDEMELLEDEADRIAPELGARGIVEEAHVLASYPDRARCREVKDAEETQHG